MTARADASADKQKARIDELAAQLSRSQRRVKALREGSSPGLATSKQRMAELSIAQDVIRAIDEELACAENVLAGHASLPPVALMLQLCQLLKNQVAALSGGSVV